MSKCKQCGEEIVKTGNYTMKILPAKRIPKKALKLIKTGDISGEQNSQHNVTKFHKFLLKRSKPANIMELTCGKCDGVTSIKMVKPGCGANKLDTMKSERNEKDQFGGNVSPLVKKRKKGKKDKMAGLTLPVSTTVVHNMEKQKSAKVGGSGDKKSDSGGASHYGKTINTKAQRQKELERLNKMLFKSKKAKKSGSTLQDFLSSI